MLKRLQNPVGQVICHKIFFGHKSIFVGHSNICVETQVRVVVRIKPYIYQRVVIERPINIKPLKEISRADVQQNILVLYERFWPK